MQRGRWEQRGVVTGRAVRRLRPAVIALLLLAGCTAVGTGQTGGTAAPTATPDATAQAAETSTANAIATASQRDLLAFQTAQASSPAATATPTALDVPTSTPVPTSSPAAQSSTAVTTPGTAYIADFRTWPTRKPAGPDPVRAGFDAGSGQYRMALTDATRAYVHWEYAPEGRAFGDFTLSVDARQLTGPSGGTYGVLFRALPKGPGDLTNAGYYLGIDASKPEVFLIWTAADNTGHVLARKTVAAIQQGDGVNHLQAQVSGNKITVTVNGTLVGTVTGPSTAPGAVGIIVVNPQQPAGPAGEGAAFSHLVVTPAP
jgi:hypothetical protein